MSTLRVDNIKSRTGTTVTIPNSHTLSLSGTLSSSGNISTTGDISAANLTLSGDLTVNGATTTINATTITVDDKNIELGSTASPTDTTANGGGITIKGTTDKTLIWNDSNPDYWEFTGGDLKVSGLDVSSLLRENVNIVAGKLSDNTNIDVQNGMVHYFTTTETTTSTPNIRYNSSTTLNAVMSIGEAISITLITTAAAGAYSAQLTIDGAAVTERWIGGTTPSSGGSSGVDLHTYTIIKTANATFTVIASQSKTSS